jgi:hypothetical protein
MIDGCVLFRFVNRIRYVAVRFHKEATLLRCPPVMRLTFVNQYCDTAETIDLNAHPSDSTTLQQDTYVMNANNYL